MDRPTLWHIRVSHFSEKVRWALDYKGLGYEPRESPPGAHMVAAMWLTRGGSKTFPVLRLDGGVYGDSTEIIAALDREVPEPPLIPADPALRVRALELEDFFDENLGPQIRRLAWYEIIGQAAEGGAAMREVGISVLPARLRGVKAMEGPAAAFGGAFVKLRYRAQDPDGADNARAAVLAALDRLEAELGDREYLVGDSFTVADLTAASLFYPLVRPPEGPQVIKTPPERLLEWWAPHDQRPGPQYVRRMFDGHR